MPWLNVPTSTRRYSMTMPTNEDEKSGGEASGELRKVLAYKAAIA